jgi:XTP/dITP diphosphohydrolase
VKKELLFVSSNPHKVDEIRKLLPADFHLVGLSDINWTNEIPEPFETFEENAGAKVSLVFKHTGIPCFADDSGLEVDALDKRPGVFSARYAGENKSSEENIKRVLKELGDTKNRTARFVAVIAYQPKENEIKIFRGTVEGHISYSPLGKEGFGYDPVFIPDGFDQTFGQLSPLIKKSISHRAKAMAMFLAFLNK